MATIFSEIQFLSPQQSIVMNIYEGGWQGISSPYNMSIKFSLRIRGAIDINLRLRIDNSKLFSFANGESVLHYSLKNIRDGDVYITTPFQITNLEELTGMQLVLSTEANDVGEPSNIDYDSETYDVIKAPFSHIATEFYIV